jgi:hypothetical protein
MNLLDDLARWRGKPSQGGNPHRFAELYGGEIIHMSAWEPDASTFRGKYYYNTTTNNLYIKVPCTKVMKFKYRTVTRKSANWKLITQD